MWLEIIQKSVIPIFFKINFGINFKIFKNKTILNYIWNFDFCFQIFNVQYNYVKPPQKLNEIKDFEAMCHVFLQKKENFS